VARWSAPGAKSRCSHAARLLNQPRKKEQEKMAHVMAWRVKGITGKRGHRKNDWTLGGPMLGPPGLDVFGSCCGFEMEEVERLGSCGADARPYSAVPPPPLKTKPWVHMAWMRGRETQNHSKNQSCHYHPSAPLTCYQQIANWELRPRTPSSVSQVSGGDACFSFSQFAHLPPAPAPDS
jgi:hypothetical protein